MHAKLLLLKGRNSIQLLVSTANFASNKRSQNAFWKSPVLYFKQTSTLQSTTPFQRRLRLFFKCFDAGIHDALRQTLDKSIDKLLSAVDFRSIPPSIHLVTTTPSGCSKEPTGLKQIKDIRKPKTDFVTLQPTSFGAHLDVDFWKEIRAAFNITNQHYRIVCPKLCVYSKIQRKRLQCVPHDVRSHFEDFVWKDNGYNQSGSDEPNVPHFKLYYGEKKNKIKWILFTSMSLSLGACGRFVCPSNMFCIYKNRCCRCSSNSSNSKCKQLYVGRNFEMGVMFTSPSEISEISVPIV
jgi:hypothetical protein